MESRFGSDAVKYSNEPVEEATKPYLLTLNGETIYDKAVTGKPIIFATHKYFGEPDPSVFEAVCEKVAAALGK